MTIQNVKLVYSISKMRTKEILRKIKDDYTSIAEGFDMSRATPWPEFDLFLRFLKLTPPKGADRLRKQKKIRLLDVGCGNGRLADFLKNQPIKYTGVDNNRKLLEIAKKKYPKAMFRYADALKLPFPPRSFDSVWCIAVLHHIPPELHLRALKEICRMLKKNGTLMLTVWHLWQPKYKKYINAKTGRALIPWGVDKKIHRFYYAFRPAQLRQLLKTAGFSTLKKVRSMHNIAYIGLK